MKLAFVSSLPISSLSSTSSSSQSPAICSFNGMRKVFDNDIDFNNNNNGLIINTNTTTTMRCRRDLKKEKRLRNLEFARAHRKRTVKTYNRRSQQEAINNADNDFLSSIYGTIRFRSDQDAEESSPKK